MIVELLAYVVIAGAFVAGVIAGQPPHGRHRRSRTSNGPGLQLRHP